MNAESVEPIDGMSSDGPGAIFGGAVADSAGLTVMPRFAFMCALRALVLAATVVGVELNGFRPMLSGDAGGVIMPCVFCSVLSADLLAIDKPWPNIEFIRFASAPCGWASACCLLACRPIAESDR